MQSLISTEQLAVLKYRTLAIGEAVIDCRVAVSCPSLASDIAKALVDVKVSSAAYKRRWISFSQPWTLTFRLLAPHTEDDTNSFGLPLSRGTEIATLATP